MRVQTIYGTGEVIESEGKEGIMSQRSLIRLDIVPDYLKSVHALYNGIYIFNDQLHYIAEPEQQKLF